MNHIKYSEFPHIFNKIIGYIIDTQEVKEIKEYMERIRGYNYRVYVGIVRDRIELYQIRRLDTKKTSELYTTQSVKEGYTELLRYLQERGYKLDNWACANAELNRHIEKMFKLAHKNRRLYVKDVWIW